MKLLWLASVFAFTASVSSPAATSPAKPHQKAPMQVKRYLHVNMDEGMVIDKGKDFVRLDRGMVMDLGKNYDGLDPGGYYGGLPPKTRPIPRRLPQSRKPSGSGTAPPVPHAPRK